MSKTYESWKKVDLINECHRLHKLIDEQIKELEQLKMYKAMAAESYWATPKNERGAGRKPKLTRELQDEIKRMRETGETLRQIAKSLGVSTGLVHKALKLPDNF